jgi:ELWxxDGT repeat protein
MKTIVLSLLCLFTVSTIATAQVPIPAYTGTATEPSGEINYNGKMYFAATSTTTGMELWSFNGTGTPALVADLYNSTGNGVIGIGFGRPRMAVFQNKLYFPGNNGFTGTEPFVYDGVNPPVLIDLRPGLYGSGANDFLTFGSRLYFTASSKIDSGYTSLYRYDGINPPVEISGGYQTNPAGLTAYKGKVYFSASGAGGNELYAYDTLGGTVSLVKDISVSSGGGPMGFIVANGKLYFTAREDNYGNELFSYDGTTVTRLTDIAPGGLSGVSYNPWGNMAYYKGAIYFGGAYDAMSYQLYKYDIATATPSLVKTIYAGQNANPAEFYVFNGKLYFDATDNVSGAELWVTDSSSTYMLADIDAGSFDGLPYAFHEYNNELYFSASSTGVGRLLFKLNGATGITNTSFKGAVSLAPNPAREATSLLLDLPTPQKLAVTLTDALGCTVWQQHMSDYPSGHSGILIPTRSLAAGTYYYRLSDGNGTALAAGRMVKE